MSDISQKFRVLRIQKLKQFKFNYKINIIFIPGPMLDMLNGMQHLMTGSNEFDPVFYERLVTCLNKVSISERFSYTLSARDCDPSSFSFDHYLSDQHFKGSWNISKNGQSPKLTQHTTLIPDTFGRYCT